MTDAPAAAKRREKMMTFWEHLGELRNRIFAALAAVVLGMTVAFVFRVWIYNLLLEPLARAAPDVKLVFLAVQEPWLIYFRLAFFGGLVLASPVVLWEAWAFVAPALKPREKRLVLPVLPVVLGLFVAGVLFVYWLLLPVSIHFLLSFAHKSAQPMLTQEKYFGFVTALCVSGGLLFQLPAVLVVLGWLRLVTARWLWQRTGWALVVLMTLAAIITPTGDAFNMLVLTAPLIALYLVGVVLVWLIQRGRRNESGDARV